MQIRTSENATEKVGPRWKIVLPNERNRKQAPCTLDASRIVSRYVHFALARFEFPVKCVKIRDLSTITVAIDLSNDLLATSWRTEGSTLRDGSKAVKTPGTIGSK